MKSSRTERRRTTTSTAPPPHPAAPSSKAEEARSATAASGALIVTLAALALLRAAFAFVPGTWLWPLSVLRFLAPVAAWAPWLLAALALVPALARRAVPAMTSWGDAIARGRVLPIAGLTLGAAALVALIPDQVRFVGDFLLRQGTVEVIEQPGVLFPQALPLDVWLHYTVPLKLTAAHLLDANGAARLVGAIDAALLALCAMSFARAMELRGAPALATAAVVFFGGYLGMFTGFSKAFAEMCVLMALAAVSAVRVLRTGRGLLTLGIATAIAIALHRSALGMLPAVALVWVLWLRRAPAPAPAGRGRGATPAARSAWRRADVLLGAALPITALAIMGPRIVGTVVGTDAAVHFAPAEVRAQGGVLRAAFAGTRVIDLLSLVLMLSPLAIALPALVPLRGRTGHDRELLVLAALALPFVGVMPFLHPAQGLYRDWDDFAATGVAMSLVTAWLVGTTLRVAPRSAWLALAIVLGVAVPAVQWLLVHGDSRRGLERVRAFVTEPPTRTPRERGMTWDYLGIRSYRLERYPEAQAAFARAVETSPSPRILQEWAVSATMAGDLRAAQNAYHRLLIVSPENSLGWLGLAAVSMRLRDVPEAKRAAIGLRRLVPGSAEAAHILDDIARYEALQADSLAKVRH
jgi:hypothetical protein